MKIDFIKITSLIEKTSPLLAMLAVLILIASALGSVARWDLLDQIAMADSYLAGGAFYPSMDADMPHGVSVYFPGVALISAAVGSIIGDYYLVEIMLVIACIFVCLFIAIQPRIINCILDINCSFNDILPLAVIVSFTLCPDWLAYASEFKPDTIAVTLGLLGLMIAGFLRQHTNYVSTVLGAILCGVALIFKQQYIAFTIGLLGFCLFSLNRVRLVFALVLLFTVMGITYSLFNTVDPWFWCVTVLMDDGFIQIKQVITDNIHTFLTLLYMFIFYVVIYESKVKTSFIGFSKEIEGAKVFFQNPWGWAILPLVLAAFAGALKNGGNSGNTQAGIILLIPIIYFMTIKFERWVILAFAWLAILSSIFTIYSGPKNYMEAYKLRNFVETSLVVKPSLVLTGSNVYFASRIYSKRAKLVNYWALSLRDNTDVTKSLPNILATISPDLIVVENWPFNRAAILKDTRYKLKFENTVGLVATLN
jgi:hypothetical protein